jgi:hypothetical protein
VVEDSGFPTHFSILKPITEVLNLGPCPIFLCEWIEPFVVYPPRKSRILHAKREGDMSGGR